MTCFFTFSTHITDLNLMYRIHYEFLELKQKEAKKFKFDLFLIYR
jgi:hypothetical protein